MFDQEDEGTRIGVVTALGVTLLVLFGLLLGLVIRQVGNKAPAAAAAAPAAITEVITEEIVLIEAPLIGDILGVVYFGLDSAELPLEAAAEVEKARLALGSTPDARLVLSGFHDASGNAAHNAELAKQRALAVRHALIATGIDPALVSLRKPDVTTGDGPAEEARRVEIRLVR